LHFLHKTWPYRIPNNRHANNRRSIKALTAIILTTSCHSASCHAGLILIHRFPLSLLFHNHRSLPIPIRGYHLQTLLTLPWLPYTSFLPLPSPSLPALHILSPSLPTPPIYAYNMPIQLLYRPALHYVHLYRLCCPSNTLATLQIQMLRNVDMHWRWRKPQWHSVTFILISGRSGEPLTSSNVASNHVDVRPTSHRRAVSPAALFSADPHCRWRHIFFQHFRSLTYNDDQIVLCVIRALIPLWRHSYQPAIANYDEIVQSADSTTTSPLLLADWSWYVTRSSNHRP